MLCSCRSGHRTPATESFPGPDAAPVEESVEGIVPEFRPGFLCDTIPPAVEARMRGNSYPEGAKIGLDELRYLRVA